MRLTMTGAWFILGALVFLTVFLAVLTAWDLRRKKMNLLISLNAVRFSHGPVTTAELAGRWGYREDRTAAILERLFSEGWAVASRDEEGERYWQITDAGVERLKRSDPQLRSLDA